MNREYIKRVVDLGLVADQDDRFLAQDPGYRADQQRRPRADEARRRRDGGQPRDGARDDADQGGLAEFDPLPQRPGERGSGGRDMGHRDRHCRTTVCGQLRAAVKAEPADPEHRRTDHHEARVMRRGVVVEAWTKEDREDQRREAGCFMHHDSAREIAHADFAKDATIGQETAAPDPMYHGRVAQQHPETREEHYKAKADTLHIGTDDQRGGDHCECHLEGEEQDLGQGA